MKNRSIFITNISGSAVNINCCNKTCRVLMVNNNMDLYSLNKFKKYKNDWNYPVHVRFPQNIIPEKKYAHFHSAIRVTVMIGQCFGLNPVLGVHEKDPNKLRFKFISWRCAYTYFIMLGQVSLICILIQSFFHPYGTLSPVDCAPTLLFYTFSLLTTVLFLRTATQWPKLCMQISEIEAVDPTIDSKLRLKFNFLTCGLLGLACLEHLFSEFNGLSVVLDCHTKDHIYEAFIRQSYPWIYYTIPYSTFVGIVAHAINIQCTFNWNFADLFIICMSIYLAARLEQINNRVKAAKNKNVPPSYWRTIREDYNRATQLVRQVDSVIGGIILISFASNLVSICLKLLHTLADGIRANPRCKDDGLPDQRLMGGYEHSIYSMYSFLFLVSRFLMVSLTASRVYIASLEPANSLYDVSSVTYCVEIERFLDQIHGNTVALSGLQFFYIKRGLILTIAGTIVTYELVLMQFTGNTPTSPSPL